MNDAHWGIDVWLMVWSAAGHATVNDMKALTKSLVGLVLSTETRIRGD